MKQTIINRHFVWRKLARLGLLLAAVSVVSFARW